MTPSRLTITRELAVLCVGLLIAQKPYILAQQPQPAAGGSQNQPQTVTPGQLDSLVAPIALYPDPILSQVLVASTYPLEIVEAQRWLSANSNLKGDQLTAAAAKQPWDASVQALVIFPDVLKRLSDNISWTSDLGNAFLAQQAGVMDAVQRLRLKAKENNALQSNPQQTVSTTSENNQTIVQIEPANPQVVYVPQYNPAAVWGPASDYYPYPSMYYPGPSYAGAAAASALSFGLGVAVGSLWGGGWGGWGWGSNWGSRTVVVNNNFIRRNNFNRANVTNGNRWVHNPEHRGGVPYNRGEVANRFNPGRQNPNVPRPTQHQIQQRLGQQTPGWRGNVSGHPGQPGQGPMGGAARGAIAPHPGQGGQAFRPNAGGAARMAPGNVNRGGMQFGNRGMGGGERIGNRNFRGGGGFHGGMFGGMGGGGGRARMSGGRGFASRGGGRRR